MGKGGDLVAMNRERWPAEVGKEEAAGYIYARDATEMEDGEKRERDSDVCTGAMNRASLSL